MPPGKKDEPENPPSGIEEKSPFPDPVALPIEDSIDLHPFSPRDIPSVVEEYIEQCRQAGIYEVRLVHGRGKGVQRRVVHSLLARLPLVESFKDAPTEAGGWGATLVQLRKVSSIE
ncbi:MAG: Smr/MutS family protein [Candidatus Binatia bacterium]|jgi:DNA-nicking Smr family endonuclease|nr:Smr/MutS family protein [Candidatus Binatia bacterium]|tara:strand:+ start:297 stop:644 length:348 start_codon:yes stop_codon:yes gene_type:complete